MVGFWKNHFEKRQKNCRQISQKSFFKMAFFDKSIKMKEKSSENNQNMPKFYVFL